MVATALDPRKEMERLMRPALMPKSGRSRVLCYCPHYCASLFSVTAADENADTPAAVDYVSETALKSGVDTNVPISPTQHACALLQTTD